MDRSPRLQVARGCTTILTMHESRSDGTMVDVGFNPRTSRLPVWIALPRRLTGVPTLSRRYAMSISIGINTLAESPRRSRILVGEAGGNNDPGRR